MRRAIENVALGIGAVLCVPLVLIAAPFIVLYIVGDMVRMDLEERRRPFPPGPRFTFGIPPIGPPITEFGPPRQPSQETTP